MNFNVLSTVAHYVDELNAFFEEGSDYELLQDHILQLKDIAHLKSSAEQLQASINLGKAQGLIHELLDAEIPETLSSSLIQFQDAQKEALDAIHQFLDEDRTLKLSELTKRMNHWHDLARKHQVHPMDLSDTFQQLQEPSQISCYCTFDSSFKRLLARFWRYYIYLGHHE